MSEHEQQSAPRSRLRQRLVGALVVVALAVLLLPLWLDGGGLKTPEVQPIPATPTIAQPAEISIPTPTASQLNELQNPPATTLPAQEPVSPPPAAPSTLTQPPVVIQPTPPVKAPELKQPIKLPPPKPDEATHITPPQEIKKSLTQEQKPSGTVVEKPPVTQVNPSSSPHAAANEDEWVVQLGSFSDELNARGLAKSVSDAGFKVDVSPLFAKKGTVWRVRVGPYATREQAVKTTTQLRERLGRDGLVMPK
ncbi:MAG: SPOR domain-containing protein [Halothiobacillus sp.]